MKSTKTPKQKLATRIITIIATLTFAFGACTVYVNDYYRADAEAIAAFSVAGNVTKQLLDDNTIVYQPEEIQAGLIFYPGGKVEYTAYEPLMKAWYIGGHSLGGSMAASYLEKNRDNFEGLILLGSYSTADLSNTALKVMSLYGSEDQVLNQEKYIKNKSNLPENFTEIILEGGCHAYFGMYGAQEGDGTPTISNTAQITQTAQAISDFIKK